MKHPQMGTPMQSFSTTWLQHHQHDGAATQIGGEHNNNSEYQMKAEKIWGNSHKDGVLQFMRLGK